MTTLRLSPQDFFDTMARALEDGHQNAFATVMQVPTTVRIGTSRLYCDTEETVVEFMRQYRKNLMVDGYRRSTATVLADDPAPGDARRVLVHWQHFNRNGAVIREIYGSYFMVPTNAGNWLKTKVEFVDDAPARLLQGIPVAPCLA